jgi:Restriction endonuclease
VVASRKSTPKRIAPGAYQALREALPAVFWYRRSFGNYLRLALRDHPELLAGLNFDDIKRCVADELVDRLAQREDRYQQTTIHLMIAVASVRRFQDLEKLDDAQARIADARKAVAELQRWTEQYSGAIAERERREAAQVAASQQAEVARRFADEVEALRLRFLEMHGLTNPQQRGYAFQDFLDKLFGLFDMEPRSAYVLEREQIDGSVTFDTDDYIVEARWWKGPVGRADADVFATKVRRKGRNALGLFVSVNGFTVDALEEYGEETPFLAIDGMDLMCVLEQRVRLDELLRRKKRHANETGQCHFPASKMVAG